MKRILALTLALLLLCPLLPAAAIPAGADCAHTETTPVFGPETREPTRGNLLYLMWQMRGAPEPTLTENPYSDVSEDAEYYKAVLWAYETELSVGPGGGMLVPEWRCNRSQAVYYLWKAFGSPEAPEGGSPFADVGADVWYTEPITWAAAQPWIDLGVPEGSTLFSPDDIYFSVTVSVSTCQSCGETVYSFALEAVQPTFGSCGFDLKWSFDAQSGCLSVTGIGNEMWGYSAGDAPWYGLREEILQLELPDTLQTVGRCAFYNCTALKEVTLSAAVHCVRPGAFSGCTALERITVLDKDCVIQHEGYPGTLGTPGKTVIRGYTYSTAHAYASGYGFAFEALDELPEPVQFTDVAPYAYYAAAVDWAVHRGVTSGTGNGRFSPDAVCTRAQVVTFLWRAMGSPAPASAENPFEDVPAGQWYTDAVLWAVGQKITSGTGGGKFSPEAPCTRAQVVTFLWRAEGRPTGVQNPLAGNPFTDVPTDSWYGKAVRWAVDHGITTGTGSTRFSPEMECSRAQIVTFLYRDMT